MSRTVAPLALVALLIAGSAGGAAAQAQSERSGLPPVTYEEVVGPPRAAAGYNMTAIALGAVAGVITVNAVLPALGYSVVSATLAGAPVTGATLEAALAASRVVAVAGAVAGGAVGQWLYSGQGR